MALDVATIRSEIGKFIREDVENGSYLDQFDDYAPSDPNQFDSNKTYAPDVELKDYDNDGTADDEPPEWVGLWHYVVKALVGGIRSDLSIIAESYNSSSQTIDSSEAVLDLDSDRIFDSSYYNRSGGQIQVVESTRYEINGAASFETVSGSGNFEVAIVLQRDDSTGSWSNVSGTVAQTSWIDETSGFVSIPTAYLNLKEQEMVRLKAFVLEGSGFQTIQDSVNLSLEATF